MKIAGPLRFFWILIQSFITAHILWIDAYLQCGCILAWGIVEADMVESKFPLKLCRSQLSCFFLVWLSVQKCEHLGCRPDSAQHVSKDIHKLLTTTKKTFQSVSHQVFQNNDLRIQTPAGGSFAYSPSYWSPCLSGRGQKPAHCQCSAGQPRWASDTGTAWPPLGPLSPPGQTEKRHRGVLDTGTRHVYRVLYTS